MAKRKNGMPRSLANDRTSWDSIRNTKSEQERRAALEALRKIDDQIEDMERENKK